MPCNFQHGQLWAEMYSRDRNLLPCPTFGSVSIPGLTPWFSTRLQATPAPIQWLKFEKNFQDKTARPWVLTYSWQRNSSSRANIANLKFGSLANIMGHEGLFQIVYLPGPSSCTGIWCSNKEATICTLCRFGDICRRIIPNLATCTVSSKSEFYCNTVY